MGPLVTPRAYSGFCLVILASQAKRTGDYGAFPLLLGGSLGAGHPTPMQLLLFAAFWLLPMHLRQSLRALVLRAGRPDAGPGGRRHGESGAPGLGRAMLIRHSLLYVVARIRPGPAGHGDDGDR